MWTAKTLIRLGGCPGWSESSLGAYAVVLVLSWGGSYSRKSAMKRNELHYTWFSLYFIMWINFLVPWEQCKSQRCRTDNYCPLTYAKRLSIVHSYILWSLISKESPFQKLYLWYKIKNILGPPGCLCNLYFRNNFTIKLLTSMYLKDLIMMCVKFGSDSSFRINWLYVVKKFRFYGF